MIDAGKFEGISLEEYMQVSFLSLISGDEVHVEDKVVYGGNVFLLHACVSQVNPAEKVEALREVI
jgi:hypothetical protein